MAPDLSTLHWWQRGIVYQIYPRSFQDTTHNGVGDLAGIIARLDYLNDGTPASLGVDAIWLSPFYPSPMKDFGYDVADYCDVDPLLGDLATFDWLVADNCFVYLRETDEARCLIALSFAAEARQVAIHGEAHGAIVLSTHLDREGPVTRSSFALRPYEGVIIELGSRAYTGSSRWPSG
jgi:hypothetical protein